jgi:Zn-dependent M28 family amino/carboxypeptidase/uncharacterized protein (DUF1684 family)
MQVMQKKAAVFLLCLGLASCSGPPKAEAPAMAPPPPGRLPLADLPDIDASATLSHIKALSSDEFEGRAPGSRGETRAIDYIVSQFKQMGLTSGTPDGSFTQKVPLVGITTPGAPLVLTKGTTVERLKWKDEVIGLSKHVAPSASLNDSELVFVGYGVVAPEYNWDDYKGLDVKGKTLVMLVNDPPIPDPSNASQLDPRMFGGKAMTYYGRWTYKYEIAAQKGAAGVLIVHENATAGYPFEVLQNSLGGENFDLVTPDKNMSRASFEGWVPVDVGRKILRMGGQDYDDLKKLAATPDFKPVPLGVTASITLHNKLRTIDSHNVLARLEGSDPALKDEDVVYMAHWDHLGVGDAVNGDKIYNGAIDNASGVAGLLEIAHAFKELAVPPKRTILFAAVTAEEQGLLGSAYYAANPVMPLAKTLATINMDSMNVHGRTKDVTVIGYGASDLDDYVRDAAAEQGRVIRPDPSPEKGYFYRSDHFSFAKQGVPALYVDPGVDFVGKPADYGTKVRDDYEEHDYHKPSDEVRPDWDLSGDREDLKLLMAVGYRVAQSTTFPNWKPGNEFKAAREAMLASSDPVAEVQAFRKKHEASYTAEYVPLAGLFFLKDGVNTAGSAASNDVRLPSRVPASVGRFVYHDQKVRFEPSPGSPVTAKGKPVTAPLDLKSDETEPYDELAIGDVAFWLHESGDRRAIRLRDPQSDQAKSFAGYHWFPIDANYRVVGRFIRDPAPHEIKTGSLAGDLQTYTTEGVVEFTLNGETLRLRPMTTRPDRFYFIFRDGTSGKETYDAARFLYSDLRPDGTTILDFNEAYNPPCSFNEFTTCPLPLPENRLKARILAGEKAYAGPHH